MGTDERKKKKSKKSKFRDKRDKKEHGDKQSSVFPVEEMTGSLGGLGISFGIDEIIKQELAEAADGGENEQLEDEQLLIHHEEPLDYEDIEELAPEEDEDYREEKSDQEHSFSEHEEEIEIVDQTTHKTPQDERIKNFSDLLALTMEVTVSLKPTHRYLPRGSLTLQERIEQAPKLTDKTVDFHAFSTPYAPPTRPSTRHRIVFGAATAPASGQTKAAKSSLPVRVLTLLTELKGEAKSQPLSQQDLHLPLTSNSLLPLNLVKWEHIIGEDGQNSTILATPQLVGLAPMTRIIKQRLTPMYSDAAHGHPLHDIHRVRNRDLESGKWLGAVIIDPINVIDSLIVSFTRLQLPLGDPFIQFEFAPRQPMLGSRGASSGSSANLPGVESEQIRAERLQRLIQAEYRKRQLMQGQTRPPTPVLPMSPSTSMIQSLSNAASSTFNANLFHLMATGDDSTNSLYSQSINYGKIQTDDPLNLSLDRIYEKRRRKLGNVQVMSEAMTHALLAQRTSSWGASGHHRAGRGGTGGIAGAWTGVTGEMLMHSLPAVKLLSPFFKTMLSTQELRYFHRYQENQEEMTKYKTKESLTMSRFVPVGEYQVTTIHVPGLATSNIPVSSSSGMQLRTSKRLSLVDGTPFLLIEWSEQWPHFLSNPGMVYQVVHYYRRTSLKDPFRLMLNQYPGFGCVYYLEPEEPSPFPGGFGDVPPGQLMPVLVSGMFKTPLFFTNDLDHQNQDYILGMSIRKHQQEDTTSSSELSSNVFFIRPMRQVLVAGQQIPLLSVPAPTSRTLNGYYHNRSLVLAHRSFAKHEQSVGLPLVRIQRIYSLLPQVSEASIRKWCKEVADIERLGKDSTGIWKRLDNVPPAKEDYLRSLVTPEQVCVTESSMRGQQAMADSRYIRALIHTPLQELGDMLIARISANAKKQHATSGVVGVEHDDDAASSTGQFLDETLTNMTGDEFGLNAFEDFDMFSEDDQGSIGLEESSQGHHDFDDDSLTITSTPAAEEADETRSVEGSTGSATIPVKRPPGRPPRSGGMPKRSKTDKPLHSASVRLDSKVNRATWPEARFAPWTLTNNFMAALQGKVVLDLTGPADPSGQGLAFSFVRVPIRQMQAMRGNLGIGTGAGTSAIPSNASPLTMVKSSTSLATGSTSSSPRSLSVVQAQTASHTASSSYRADVQRIWEAQWRWLSIGHGVQSVKSLIGQYNFGAPQSSFVHHLPKIVEWLSYPPSSTSSKLKPQTQSVSTQPTHFRSAVIQHGQVQFDEDEQQLNDLARFLATSSSQQAEQVQQTQSTPVTASSICLLIERVDDQGACQVQKVTNSLVITAYLKERSLWDASRPSSSAKHLVLEDKPIVLKTRRKKRTPEERDREKAERQRMRQEERRIKREQQQSGKRRRKKKQGVEEEGSGDTGMVSVRCGSCGALGHMRTNRICPRYAEYEEEVRRELVRAADLPLEEAGIRIEEGGKISITRASLVQAISKKTEKHKKTTRAEGDSKHMLFMDEERAKRQAQALERRLAMEEKRRERASVIAHFSTLLLGIVQNDLLEEKKDIAWPFATPVSKKKYPLYYRLIAKPRDLGTIRKRLQTQLDTHKKIAESVPSSMSSPSKHKLGTGSHARPRYLCSVDLLDDIDLMALNCVSFNGPDHPFTIWVNELKDIAHSRIDALSTELTELESKIASFSTSLKLKSNKQDDNEASEDLIEDIEHEEKTKTESNSSVSHAVMPSVDIASSVTTPVIPSKIKIVLGGGKQTSSPNPTASTITIASEAHVTSTPVETASQAPSAPIPQFKLVIKKTPKPQNEVTD